MSKQENPIDLEVHNFLAACNVTFSARLVGPTKRDDWECDEWRISIKAAKIDTTFEYFTGTGHREIVRGSRAISIPGNNFVRGQWEAGKPVAPSAASVFHSLIMDGRAIDESFSDWCDEYGYDTDSRKALATYEACCESGRKLRKIFTPKQRQQLADMLQDY